MIQFFHNIFSSDCFEDNVKYFGDGFMERIGQKYVVYENAEECQKACQKYEECKDFTFQEPYKTCSLWTLLTRKEYALDHVSGKKFCKGLNSLTCSSYFLC